MAVTGQVFDDFYRTLEVTQFEVRISISEDIEGEKTKELVYRCGVLDRAVEDASENSEGMRMMMAEIRSKSGHRFHALVDIMVPDSGEHWGTQLVVAGPEVGQVSLIEQGTPEFWAWMESAEKIEDFEFSPYRYRYLDESKRERDHHVDPETGWSY